MGEEFETARVRKRVATEDGVVATLDLEAEPRYMESSGSRGPAPASSDSRTLEVMSNGGKEDNSTRTTIAQED